MLEEFLGERRGANVEIRVAARGDKRRMLELAQRNAELALRHDALVAERTRARRAEALEELREALDLEALPVRIECFDISNLGETEPSSPRWWCSRTAVARKSDYRKFAISHERRARTTSAPCARSSGAASPASAVEEDGYDRCFATLPNLV